MGNLFNINGKLYHYMEQLTHCIFSSLLWLLFSLPIVTIGASTTALYYTVHKVICKGSGKLYATFWAAFRENFKQSTLLWLIVLLVMATLVADFYICFIMSGISSTLKWMLLLIVALAAFVIMWSHYLFSYVAHIRDSVKTILKNTLILCVMHFSKSFVFLVLFLVCVITLLCNPGLTFLIVILPAGYMLAAHFFLERVYRNYWDTDLPTDENANLS